MAPDKTTQITPGRFRHYKGNYYEVIGIARDSETEEPFVVYRCLYGDYSLWIRPISRFVDTVTIDGKEVPRFRRCEDQ